MAQNGPNRVFLRCISLRYKWSKTPVLRLCGQMVNAGVIQISFDSITFWRMHLFATFVFNCRRFDVIMTYLLRRVSIGMEFLEFFGLTFVRPCRSLICQKRSNMVPFLKTRDVMAGPWPSNIKSLHNVCSTKLIENTKARYLPLNWCEHLTCKKCNRN